MAINVNMRASIVYLVQYATLLAGLLLITASLYASEQPAAPDGAGQAGRDSGRPATVCTPSAQGSPYIPVDSWVYPAVMRLYSMGYLDHVYLGMRPWTRASLSHMLEDI